MIQRITIKNFKSILTAMVDLGPLTVLVGANGTGKSNLIKALSFLGDISRSGLQSAVHTAGGFGGLLPKAIPRGDLGRTNLSLRYRKVLGSPEGYPPSREPIFVDHEFSVGRGVRGAPKVRQERLEFSEPLTVGWALRNGPEDPASEPPEEGSRILVERRRGGRAKRTVEPKITPRNLADYMSWFGFPFFTGEVVKPKQFEEILNSIIVTSPHGGSARGQGAIEANQCFLDPNVALPIALAGQYRVLCRDLGSIRRYDLLLNELRAEQPAASDPRLKGRGSNVPSVVAALTETKEEEERWSRVIAVFTAIAPHVRVPRSDSLRSGKWFVEFEERNSPRSVESWESSDGTLRALAILLALETHPRGGMILIEEPEQNLHPWAIRTLMKHVRETVERRGLQVVLTTHSQQVLEVVDPGEVLVVHRDNALGTLLTPVSESFPGQLPSSGELGRLWVKGLLGGVPDGVG